MSGDGTYSEDGLRQEDQQEAASITSILTTRWDLLQDYSDPSYAEETSFTTMNGL